MRIEQIMRHKKIVEITILALAITGSVIALIWWRGQPATQIIYEYAVELAFPNLSFDRPVGIYSVGDGSNRLFVLEKRGVILSFENSENVTSASVFLDIRDRVNSNGAEEGLLGLAFHPNFTRNGFFYLDYTASNPRRTVIARYTVTPNNPSQADRDLEQIILEVPQPQPYANHNGGQLAFGPDGYLYIAMGDGGGRGDPQGNAQNRMSSLGKILRIDVNNPSGDMRYGIPADNPFVGTGNGYRGEIYAFGLRNPWRFSFDPVTGWLWAADVGQDTVEEIDIIEKGKNYGWNIMEGNRCFSTPEGCNQTGLEPPIWSYNHSQGESITGGFVYRGSRLKGLIGHYIYGDFVSGRIWALRKDTATGLSNKELIRSNLSITSFGVDEKNELFICAFEGKIYKLTESQIGS